MNTNIAAWMIAGGPRSRSARRQRDREQLHAFRESQRAAHAERRLIARIRGIARAAPRSRPISACCPA